MKPAASIRWLVEEAALRLAVWSAYSPEVRTELGSTALGIDGKWWFFDPVALEEAALAELLAHGEPAGVVLTNANHERDAPGWAGRFGVPIYAAAPGAFPFAVEAPERLGARCGLKVFQIEGAAEGERAFYHPAGLLILGDALIHLADTGFAFLPGRYCLDPARMRRSLRGLGSLSPRWITFAHGEPLADAGSRLRALLEE